MSILKPQKVVQLKDYPWMLSAEADLKPIPTIWNSFKSKNMVQAGENMVRSLLKDDAYAFPFQFYQDVSKVLEKTFKLLSSKEAKDQEQLEKYMAQGIAKLYSQSYLKLSSTQKFPNFTFKPKKVHISKIHLTYGPLIIPDDYVMQDWFDFITIILPEEDSIFVSHPRQSELLEIAKGQGCHFRIDTTIDCDLEFSIINQNNLPLIRDKRDSIQVSFSSPHFTPWDEIFKLKDDGSWELIWDWKIVDIDGKLNNQSYSVDIPELEISESPLPAKVDSSTKE